MLGVANLPLPPIRLRESVIDTDVVEPLSDPRGPFHPCSSGDEGIRSDGLSRKVGSVGQTPHESDPVGLESSMEPTRPVTRANFSRRGVQTRLAVVAGRLTFAGRSSSPPPGLSGVPVYR